MATKRSKELRTLTQNELETRLRETEKELFGIRMQKATGQLSDTAKIWRIKKDVARMKTFMAQLSGGSKATRKAASAKAAQAKVAQKSTR